MYMICQISWTNSWWKAGKRKIRVDSVGVNGINILNLTNGKTTQTNNTGRRFLFILRGLIFIIIVVISDEN
jgi:hypothetical protein